MINSFFTPLLPGLPPVKAQAHAKPVRTASTVNIAKKMVALAAFVNKPASQLKTTL